MTNLIDFDRSLAEFLADGPNTAPDAPVIAALAHARTTPRRPDLLGRFRSDVMAPPRTLGLLRRPGLLFALLALVVAGIGVAVIGSRPTDPSIVVPGPTASPTAPLPSVEPGGSATPTDPSAPIGSPSVTPIHVVLEDESGGPTSIDVVDGSGLLRTAVAGPQTGGNGFSDFKATNDDPTTLRLTWPGRPCDTIHRLTIDAALTNLTIDLPNCRGDALGADRTLILTFSQPVDAQTLSTSLLPGRGGVGMPSWTVTAPDSASGIYDLTLVDPGNVVETVEGYFDAGVTVADAGSSGLRLTTTDGRTFHLLWADSDCAGSPELSIDETGDHWQLTKSDCSATIVARMIDVTLRAPRPAGSPPSIEFVRAP